MKAVEVVLGEQAKQDIRELLAEPKTKAVGVEALKRCMALEENPYQGDKLRYKANRKPLADAKCHKLSFDAPDHPAEEPDRYRIVYRLEPHDGSPARAHVFVVALKRQAYGEGIARAASRLRELAGERAQALRSK